MLRVSNGIDIPWQPEWLLFDHEDVYQSRQCQTQAIKCLSMCSIDINQCHAIDVDHKVCPQDFTVTAACMGFDVAESHDELQKTGKLGRSCRLRLCDVRQSLVHAQSCLHA